VGHQVTYTATVTPAPDGGTVIFEDGPTTISGCGSQAVDTTTGTATCQVIYTAPGSHSITAFYSGDSNFNSSDNSLSPYSQAVNTAATTTTLSSSANPAVLGQSVTFTVTVAVALPGAGTPAGTVDFYDGATKLGSGTLSTKAGITTVSFATSVLAVGSHPIPATYNTDGHFASSTSSAVTQLVRYGVSLLYKPPMSGKVQAQALGAHSKVA
jgi:hypothetical protein